MAPAVPRRGILSSILHDVRTAGRISGPLVESLVAGARAVAPGGHRTARIDPRVVRTVGRARRRTGRLHSGQLAGAARLGRLDPPDGVSRGPGEPAGSAGNFGRI